MRKLVITQNVTLDGAVEMLDPWFDAGDDDPRQAEALRQQAARSDAVLFGRQTFTDMRGFWPEQTDDTTGVADHLNRTRRTCLRRHRHDRSPPTRASPGTVPELGIRNDVNKGRG